MGKFRWVIVFFLSCFLMTPLFAHADSEGYNLNYDVNVQAFYWATHIATPQYQSDSGSYAATVDVRFKQGSGMDNWGLGAEYNNIVNGPRLVNTGGASVSSFNGITGTAVSQNGVFGLVVPGSIQFGGGKLKYFFPVTNPKLRAAVYGDFFSATAGLTAIGGGGELGYSIDRNWDVSGFADLNNSTGNGFPSQTLVRYQAEVSYTIPDTNLQVLLGYRGFNYTAFNNTFINGVIAGAGVHF